MSTCIVLLLVPDGIAAYIVGVFDASNAGRFRNRWVRL
jgi:hypothetical protein